MQQVPIDDRLPESAHFENHPKGIPGSWSRNYRETTVKEVSKPKHRGGRKPIKLSALELKMVDMQAKKYPRAKIAKRLGTTYEHVHKVLERLSSRKSKLKAKLRKESQ